MKLSIMKKILSTLCSENFRYFQVWSYLWINSDRKNTIEFNYLDVGCKLKMSKSTVHRIISKTELINVDKTYVEITKDKSTVTAKFYDKGKPKTREKNVLIDDVIEYLVGFYEKQNFPYEKINNHKPQLKGLINQMEPTMKAAGLELTDETKKQFLQWFCENLPEWWVKKGHITIPALNKHYPKMITQIKTQKTDSYASEIHQTESIDYSKLAAK